MPETDFSSLRPESPIEEIFAWECQEYLDDSVSFESQVEVNTEHGQFRIDFMLTRASEKIAVECDGPDFHDFFRDEFRDAILLGEGHVPIIYHFRGKDIFHRTADCLRLLSIENPLLFSPRGRANLEHLCRLGLDCELSVGENRIIHDPTEPLHRVWAIRRDIYQSININPDWPFWRKIYDFASHHPGASLDEMISILDHQYSGRVP